MNLVSRDRRLSQRVGCNLPAVMSDTDKQGPRKYAGLLLDLSPHGGRFIADVFSEGVFRPESCLVRLDDQEYAFTIKKLFKTTIDREFRFLSDSPVLESLFTRLSGQHGAVFLADRRKDQRRTAMGNGNAEERRQRSRRMWDLWTEEFQALDEELPSKAQVLFRQKSLSHDTQSVTQRREWLESRLGKSLKSLGIFAEPTEDFTGNIENLVGVAHVPIGVAGPLRINGEHARGDFYVPMATTEGVLVNSYTLGMTLITRAGGATVRLLTDEMRISPLFVFDNLRQAIVFNRWVNSNFQKIKEAAESTTKHGKLIRLETKLLGRQVAVLFVYDTGDAMGLNMICKATETACQYILSSIKPQAFYLRSNYSSNKKVSHFNMQNSYGKSLITDVVIPKRLLSLLDTTPEHMAAYSQSRLTTGIHAGMVGNNGHYANGLAAIFIACGQDVAHVANSHVGVSHCEITASGDLYVSAHVPNLLVATVGGGTGLATSRACLEMLDCYGNGKAKKLAEIMAATLLAGEISICLAIVNGTYVEAHERSGRNRPK